MTLVRQRECSSERTFELLRVLEQACILKPGIVYHQGTTIHCQLVDATLLKERHDWFDQHELGLSAVMLADALLESQKHLVELDGIWMTRSAYQQWMQLPSPGDCLRAC